MENLLDIKTDYNSLDKLYNRLKNESNYDCSKEYDIWEQRTDSSGQMAQCVVLKKSSMHAVKVYFINDNTVKINYIIPNKIMHAYFGKSVKARRSIIEILAGTIKQAILASPQKKVFEELEHSIKTAAA